MKYIFFVIYLLLMCKSVTFAQRQIEFKMSDFPIEVDLEGQEMSTDILADPCDLKFVDTYLFILNCSGDIHFDILDTKSGKIIKRFGRKGRGPGEILLPRYFQYVNKNNRLYVYDMIRRNINIYDFNKLISGEDNYYLNSFRIDALYVKFPLLMEDDYFLCVLLGDYEGSQFCKIDFAGKFIEKFGKFPDLEKDYPTTLADNIFKSWAEVTTGRDKIVMAYGKWDRIEIRDIDAKELVTIFGPEYKIPEFSVEGENVFRKKNNPECYFDISTGYDGFMVLYYGGIIENKNEGKEIVYRYVFYFNYNGNLIAKYNLSPGVYGIAVDWDNQIIYGINREMEPKLYKYKF